MAQEVTKRQLLDAIIDVRKFMMDRFDAIDRRFDSIDRRLERMARKAKKER